MTEPNHLINSVLNKISTPVRWAIGIIFIALVVVALWYGGTRIWNGIGNYLFAKQINAERLKVQKELEAAAEQKKLLEATLTELAVAQKNYQDAKAEKDRLETIFNDQSKSAAAKVQAFKTALADDPVSTPTDNITADVLCSRAREIGASAATISALCH